MIFTFHSAIASHSMSLVPTDRMQVLEWKTPMGAIVFVVSLIDDKGNLAVMVKDSMISSFTEKFWNKKKNNESCDSSPADKKKSSISLSNLVKRRKNSSGGSVKDLGITLDDPPPESVPDKQELKARTDDEKESSIDPSLDSTVAPTIEENVKEQGPNKPSRFKFFRKKPERYTDENGEELSNNKTKGKSRRKRESSGISQISSASELSYKDAQGEVGGTEERIVRFDVGSENLEFTGVQYQIKPDSVAEQVD